jgi:sugar phosphate isomerase/epimerase
MARWLDGHGGRIGLHGPFYDLPLAARDPGIRDLVRRRLDQALSACAASGASQLVLHSPYTTWDYNNHDHFGDREEIVERCHATLADAVARAEAESVTLVLENIEDKDPMARVLLARSFGSPRVKVSLDTGHAMYAHGSNGAAPVDYYAIAAETDLEHIHLHDADGHADRHWRPGWGRVPWEALFAALRRTGARPRLLLELFPSSEVPEAAAWLAARGLVR